MNNVMNEYTRMILKQLSFYAKTIMKRYYIASIFADFAEEYILIRYYNIYPVKQNRTTTYNYYLNRKIKELSKDNEDKIKNITFMGYIFKYLICLDSEIEAVEVNKIEKHLEKIAKQYNFDDEIEISKDYRTFLKAKKNYIKKYETEDFIINTVKKNNKLYDTTLDYNIELSDLYSQKAINEVYNSAPISEDKMYVFYNLLAKKVLEDVIEYDYTTAYMIEFSDEFLISKEKQKRLLSIINDDISKEKIYLKIYSSTLEKYKKNIFNLISEGYSLVLIKDIKGNDEYDSMFKLVIEKEVD